MTSPSTASRKVLALYDKLRRQSWAAELKLAAKLVVPRERTGRVRLLNALGRVIDWGDESAYEAIAVWAASIMGVAGALEAYALENAWPDTPELPHYSYMSRDRWLALAVVITQSADEDYHQARETAERLRALVPADLDFAIAIAMLFPSEPWANQLAATYDRKAWNGLGATWETKLAALLHAVSDLELARRLMGEVTGTWAAPPAYALAYRFGPQAVPILERALATNLSAPIESEWIYGAIACIEDPAVAAFFSGRKSKKGEAFARKYFERFPGLAARAAASPGTGLRLDIPTLFRSPESPIETPEPLPPAALERAKATVALSPTMEALLHFDATWVRGLGWLEGDELKIAPALELLRGFAEGYYPAFAPLVEAFLPGSALPLDEGSDSMRFLYLASPDEHGEYPVLFIDVDDDPILGVEYGGFDLWLAAQVGLSDEMAIDRKAAAEKRLFKKAVKVLSASEIVRKAAPRKRKKARRR